jgi:hypothetical protein
LPSPFVSRSAAALARLVAGASVPAGAVVAGVVAAGVVAAGVVAAADAAVVAVLALLSLPHAAAMMAVAANNTSARLVRRPCCVLFTSILPFCPRTDGQTIPCRRTIVAPCKAL